MHASCLVCARDAYLKALLQGQPNPNSVALLPNCLDLFASNITKLHFYGCVKILCTLNSFKKKMSKHGQSWETNPGPPNDTANNDHLAIPVYFLAQHCNSSYYSNLISEGFLVENVRMGLQGRILLSINIHMRPKA